MRQAVIACALIVVFSVGTVTAHQFVTIDDQPIRSEADEVVRIPLSFHETSTATLRIDGQFAVDVVNTDDDDRVVLRLNLGALPDRPHDAVSAESGETRDPRVNDSAAVGPGNYSLVVDPTNGVGDETRLLIDDPSDGSDEANDASTEKTNPEAVAQPTDPTPELLAVIAALFGPAVPVAALAVAARLVHTESNGRQ